MKVSRSVILLSGLLSGMVLTTNASADDADDIKRLVENFYGALNDGDGEAVARHYLEGANSFQRTGLLLAPVRSAEYLNVRFEFELGWSRMEFGINGDGRG